MVTNSAQKYRIAANDSTSTHPDFNGARVRMVTEGFPASDPDAWCNVELVEDLADKLPKGTQVQLRRRRLIADAPQPDASVETHEFNESMTSDKTYCVEWFADGSVCGQPRSAPVHQTHDRVESE